MRRGGRDEIRACWVGGRRVTPDDVARIVAPDDVAWLVAEVDRQAALIRGPLSQAISEAREERDAAQAEVARLRGLLAEPSDEEADRLARIFVTAGIRAVLADLRKRAGGVS